MRENENEKDLGGVNEAADGEYESEAGGGTGGPLPAWPWLARF